MTLYALTGTPGTGKSSVSEELRTRGYDVVDGKRFIIEHGLMGELDEERDTHEVDLDLLNDALEPFRASEGLVILDSHLSHFMDSHGIIVLRCAPDYEVDCTSCTVSESADAVEKIVKGDGADYLPGKTDWSGEMDRWF